MFFYLEQVLLGLLALTFWNYVLGNGMSLDSHYRGGLGITLIGLFYLTGHAVYLTASKLPDPLASLDVKLPGGSPANEPDDADTTQAAPAPKPHSEGTHSVVIRIVPKGPASGNRSIINLQTEERGYANASSAANSRSYRSGSADFTQGGTATGLKVSVDSSPIAAAASAYAGGGPMLAWGTADQDDDGSGRNNQQDHRFGPGPRILNTAQIQNAVGLLKTKTRHDVLIVTITGDGDGPRVAEQLTEAFSSAGWDVFAETSETRFIGGMNVGQGIHFVGRDKEHESVRIAWDALKDTPARPASILPLPWRTVTPGSGQPQLGPPLTIVIGTP